MNDHHHKLVQRKVQFDYSDSPLHWIPGEPEASHAINVIHMMLPAGELWFCRLYNKALPFVKEGRLREDVQGFIRQEAMHARAHSGALERYLSHHGIDSTRYLKVMDYLFEQLLRDTPLGIELFNRTPWLKRWWIGQRCAIVAAVEHFTCILGKWILEADALDRAKADPVLLDLFRWHGAEEVEHRNVAHDLHVHLGGTFVSRQLWMFVVWPLIIYLFAFGTRTLSRQDPSIARPRSFAAIWRDGSKSGVLPKISSLATSFLRYFKPWYHPDHEANTQEALDYLARSPAASRAARAS